MVNIQWLLIAANLVPIFALPTTEGVVAADIPGSNSNATIEARADGTYGFLCKLNLDYFKMIGTCYREIRAGAIHGAAEKISGNIMCPTPECELEKKIEVTQSQSFSISIGAQADANLASDVLKGSASTGVQWSWSSATTRGTSVKFKLHEGEVGHGLFWPKLRESCGDLAITRIISSRGINTVVPFKEGSKTQTNAINACGTTTWYLKDNTADGLWSFCYTKGARKGRGCTIEEAMPLESAL